MTMNVGRFPVVKTSDIWQAILGRFTYPEVRESMEECAFASVSSGSRLREMDGLQSGRRQRSRFVATATLPSHEPPLRLRGGEDLLTALGAEVDPLLFQGGDAAAKDQSFVDSVKQIRRQQSDAGDATVNFDRFNAALKQHVLAAVQDATMRAEAFAVSELSHRDRGGVIKGGLHATSLGLVLPLSWFRPAVSQTLQALSVDSSRIQQLMAAKVNVVEGDKSSTPSATSWPADHPLRLDVDPLADAKFVASNAVVEVSTATKVAFLHRLLEQVKGATDGLGAAVSLFRDLLDVLYVDYTAASREMPPVANLSARIEQLASLPLAITQLRAQQQDAAALTDRCSYLRLAMQNWAFQLWYSQLLGRRRRERFFERLNGMWHKNISQTRKRIVFTEWRAVAHQTALGARLNQASKRFHDITDDARRRITKNQSQRALMPSAFTALVEDAMVSEELRRDVDGAAASPVDAAGPVTPLGASPARFDKPLTIGDIESFESYLLKSITDAAFVAKVCRSQITSQRERIDELKGVRGSMQDKVQALDEKIVSLVNDNFRLRAEVASLQQTIADQQQEINRLHSRIGLQEHRPWRAALCDGARQIAEVTTTSSKSDVVSPPAALIRGSPSSRHVVAAVKRPDYVGIVRDWANHCLDDLSKLEEEDMAKVTSRVSARAMLTDTAISTARISPLNRSGVEFAEGFVLMRLLYYLALPKFRPVEIPPEAAPPSPVMPTKSRGATFAQGTSKSGFAPAGRDQPVSATTCRNLIADRELRMDPMTPPPAIAVSDFAGMTFFNRAVVVLAVAMKLLGCDYCPVSPADLAESHPAAASVLLGLLYCKFAHPMSHAITLWKRRNDTVPADGSDVAASEGGSSTDGNDVGSLIPAVSSERAFRAALRGHFWVAEMFGSSQHLSKFFQQFVDVRRSLEETRLGVLLEVVCRNTVSQGLVLDGVLPVAASVPAWSQPPRGEALLHAFVDEAAAAIDRSLKGYDGSRCTPKEAEGMLNAFRLNRDAFTHAFEMLASKTMDVSASQLATNADYGVNVKSWSKWFQQNGVCPKHVALDHGPLLAFVESNWRLAEAHAAMVRRAAAAAASAASNATADDAATLLTAASRNTVRRRSMMSDTLVALPVPPPVDITAYVFPTIHSSELELICGGHRMNFREFLEAFVRVVIALRHPHTSEAHKHQTSSSATTLAPQPPKGGRRSSVLSLASRGGDGSDAHTSVAPGSAVMVDNPKPSPFAKLSLPEVMNWLVAKLGLTAADRSDEEAFWDLVLSTPVQLVLQGRSTELQAVFSAFSSTFPGGVGMNAASFARLIRDAQLLSQEFGVQTVNDIFSVAVKHDTAHSTAGAIVGIGGTVEVLLIMRYAGFCRALALMAAHRFPSPLTSFASRLDKFLARNILEPLRPKFANIARAKDQILLETAAHRTAQANVAAAAGAAAEEEAAIGRPLTSPEAKAVGGAENQTTLLSRRQHSPRR